MSEEGMARLIEPSRRAEETFGAHGADAKRPGRRTFRRRNALALLLALFVLYLVFRQGFGLDWHEVSANMREANVGLFAFAFAIFYSSFLFRTLRWQVLLENAGLGRSTGEPRLSTFELAKVIYLAWFVNCVTIARLGDMYRGYLLKRSASVSFAVTLGTVLAERLLDLAVLAVMLSATVLVAFYGTLPEEAIDTLVTGLVLSAVGVVGLLGMWRLRWLVEKVLPKRLYAHYGRFEHGTVASFRRVPLLVAYSAIGWIVEGLALYLTAAAVDVQVSVAGALLVALMASLLTTVPFTPAGLGFTEAGTVLLLQWLGLDVNDAGTVALLFRVINYWSIVALGFVLHVFNTNGPTRAYAFTGQGKEQ